MSKDYSELEEILGYHFKDKKHIDTAFIHKSYANEMHMENSSYERYEFLGDAILEYITSKELFLKYPEKSEGELTKLRASLVCEYTLSQITKELGFGKYLYLSHGEELTGGMNRPSILCDLFESVLGAIFLDGGMEEAEKYVNKFLLNDIENKSTLLSIISPALTNITFIPASVACFTNGSVAALLQPRTRFSIVILPESIISFIPLIWSSSVCEIKHISIFPVPLHKR